MGDKRIGQMIIHTAAGDKAQGETGVAGGGGAAGRGVGGVHDYRSYSVGRPVPIYRLLDLPDDSYHNLIGHHMSL